jgi:uncharacterized protein YndB with AHSA1/START domain
LEKKENTMLDQSLKLEKKILINASISNVWKALVTPEIIAKYLYGTKVKSDWKIGSEIEFSGTWNGIEYIEKGFIEIFDPALKFQYIYWSTFSGLPDLPENYSTITFELSVFDGRTELKLSQSGYQDEKSLEYSESEAGWGGVLAKLKEILEE